MRRSVSWRERCRGLSLPSSPAISASSSEEFVEVTLDFQDDDTVVLRGVEITVAGAASDIENGTSETVSLPLIKRSSSHGKLRQFSQELKQLSLDFKTELKKCSWSHGHGGKTGLSSMDSALAARALRKQRAQQDRAKSGAQKALRGLRFISGSKNNDMEAWNKVQAKFDRLAKDGCLSHSDFAQCIGKIVRPTWTLRIVHVSSGTLFWKKKVQTHI